MDCYHILFNYVGHGLFTAVLTCDEELRVLRLKLLAYFGSFPWARIRPCVFPWTALTFLLEHEVKEHELVMSTGCGLYSWTLRIHEVSNANSLMVEVKPTE